MRDTLISKVLAYFDIAERRPEQISPECLEPCSNGSDSVGFIGSQFAQRLVVGRGRWLQPAADRAACQPPWRIATGDENVLEAFLEMGD